MIPNLRITDFEALMTSIDPLSQGAGTVTSAWVSVQNYHEMAALIATGVLGAAATLDAKIQQATDNAGTGAKDLTGKAIVQIVKATGDNKQAWINFRSQDLDTNNNFAFVRISATVGAAASQIAAYLFGVSRFQPPVDSTASPAINLGAASVVQIV